MTNAQISHQIETMISNDTLSENAARLLMHLNARLMPSRENKLNSLFLIGLLQTRTLREDDGATSL